MTESILWAIGSTDGRSKELYDNFKNPNALGDVVWRVGGHGEQRQLWPLFHPSEADPDGGYRLHPYTITFDLDQEPADMYILRVQYLVIAPRLAFLKLNMNGTAGFAYLRPVPSQSGEIRLLAGLHTTIYSEGTMEIKIPGSLLLRGENRLQLIARDEGETLIVDNIEAIRRLDRMANGAGFLYQQITFSEYRREPEDAGTFLSPRVELVPTVVYTRTGQDELYERCYLYMELEGTQHAGKVSLRLKEGSREETIMLDAPCVEFGHVRYGFDLFDGQDPVSFRLEGSLNGAPYLHEGTFMRRRKWNVYISAHAHTDIGYTHRQWEVAERLCRNVDMALDMLEAQEANGGVPSFAYHMDASWALETYLGTRTEKRKAQLLKHIRAGHINLAANYADLLTQTSALEEIIRNHEFTERLLRPEGLRSELAAVVDVASITSSFPALLEGAGVSCLVHANNQDRGPFRLNGGLHRISPFYWEGQQGGRVLCWLAKMYCELRKVCGSPPVPDAAERGLDMWLQEYETDRYAPDAVLLYGQEADNTDLDPQPDDFVKRWNAQYAYPRLVAADIGEFFRYVEERFGDRLQTVRGDGGAYWEDGALSSIEQTVKARAAQAMLPAAERLEALAALHNDEWDYPLPLYDDAWRELLLYDEHTWGAYLSCTEPEALLAKDQWAVKEHMAGGAEQWAKRLLHGAAARHSLSWNNKGREAVVYNPHSWPAGGIVTVEIGKKERVFDPVSGDEIPTRAVHTTLTQAIVELWVSPIPGLSYKRFILKEAEEIPHAGESADEAEESAEAVLENRFYRLVIDTRRGFVTSWFDKQLDKELVDHNDSWGFGQLLYARGGEGTRLVSNQSDLPDGNPQVSGEFGLLRAERHRFSYGRSVVLYGKVPCGELKAEWILPDRDKRIEVRFSYRKDEVSHKEAAYIAFPLNQPKGEVLSDSQLGWVNWNRDQLPGGCKEWLPLQSGILSRGSRCEVFIASPDIPLFCVGNVVQGAWPKEKELTGGRLFSYVLNNYWNTNYKASQGGEIHFRYALTSGKAISPADAYRFGWEQRLPLFAQRMSFQDFRKTQSPYELEGGGILAALDSNEVVVSTMKKARWGEGMIVRLQEIAGKPQRVRLQVPHRRVKAAYLTDLLERERSPLPVTADGSLLAEVPAWGLTTVRVVWERDEGGASSGANL